MQSCVKWNRMLLLISHLMCVCVVGISIMLYIIGLGLGDEKDITLRGLETVRKCDKVYIEAYTSLLSFGLSAEGFSKLVKLTKFLSLCTSLYRVSSCF